MSRLVLLGVYLRPACNEDKDTMFASVSLTDQTMSLSLSMGDSELALRAFPKEYYGHMYEFEGHTIKVSLGDDGLPKTDKQGRVCGSIVRKEIGGTINVRYLGPQLPKITFLKGVDQQ